MESNEKPKLSKGEAYAQVMQCMQEASAMGANDSEPESFRNILAALESGMITPEEAVQQARAVVQGKLDYH